MLRPACDESAACRPALPATQAARLVVHHGGVVALAQQALGLAELEGKPAHAVAYICSIVLPRRLFKRQLLFNLAVAVIRHLRICLVEVQHGLAMLGRELAQLRLAAALNHMRSSGAALARGAAGIVAVAA